MCQWERLSLGRLALTSHTWLSQLYPSQKTVSAGENRARVERQVTSGITAPGPASFLLGSHEQALVARRHGSYRVGGHESSRPFTSTWVPSYVKKAQCPGAGAVSGVSSLTMTVTDSNSNNSTKHRPGLSDTSPSPRCFMSPTPTAR